jgi:hypothetical protein
MANESTEKRREPTPDASDEGSSSESDESTEYESEEPLTPRPQKRPRGEEEDDPNFDPRGATQGSRMEARVNEGYRNTKARGTYLQQFTLINTMFEGLAQVYN